MCLSIVDKTYDPPLAEEREAWGTFRDDCGRLLTGDQMFKVEPGEWVQSQRGTLGGLGVSSPYKAGFHKFRSEEAAQKYAVVGERVFRVRLRGIVAEGKQSVRGSLEPVIVAKEMYVYPEEQVT